MNFGRAIAGATVRLWPLASIALITLIASVASLGSFTLASPFTMGVSSALPDAQNAQHNPALAGVMEQSEVMASPSISIENKFLLRYPDSGTIDKSLGLMGDLTSFIPAFIYKVNPRLGIGISEFVPPLKVKQKINAVPIVILNSTQLIDINADVTMRGALGGTIGYRLSEFMSLGAKFSYRSVRIVADVIPAEGGDSLAIQHMDQTTTSLLAGILLEVIPQRLRLGLSAVIYGTNATSTSVESAFVAQQDNSDGFGKSKVTASANFSQFIAGGAWLLSPRRFIAADIDYKAADSAAKEFSMVDFQEKPVDGYARLDFRMTGEWSISHTTSLVGGYALENAGKGSGRRSDGGVSDGGVSDGGVSDGGVNDGDGDPGKAGFGIGDVIQIYTGQASLVPAQSFMGGIKLYFLNANANGDTPEITGQKAQQGSPKQLDSTGWIIAAGLGYRKASLGIDENGELPGAYQQTRIYVPFEITRRF